MADQARLHGVSAWTVPRGKFGVGIERNQPALETVVRGSLHLGDPYQLQLHRHDSCRKLPPGISFPNGRNADALADSIPHPLQSEGQFESALARRPDSSQRPRATAGVATQ